MYIKPYHCPRKECEYHINAPYGFYIKKGYFTPKWSGSPVPKYKCRKCKKGFSASTFKDIYRQHKPFLNKQIYQDLCAGKTMRRQAIHLKISRRILAKRLIWLAEKVKGIHQYELAHGVFKKNELERFQFDEMETFISSKLKTVSVALAVVRIQAPELMVKKPKKIDPPKRRYRPLIIDIMPAKRRAKGLIAEVSRHKYPTWINEQNQGDRRNALLRILKTVSRIAPEYVAIYSDKDTSFVSVVKQVMPLAKHIRIKSRMVDLKQEVDPLFFLNHTCARIRADLCRMRRKTWATSKKIENLEAHLWVYLAWNNGYTL
jgi:transposase-like protein